MAEPLYMCNVDATMAFALVNRHILFYESIKQGWSGTVNDTQESFIPKCFFRVIVRSRFSPLIPNHMVVNQDVNVIDYLFSRNDSRNS